MILSKSAKFSKYIIPALMLTISTSIFANGGITLGSTRIIYPESSKQISISVSNTSTDTSFLVQSWIEDDKGTKTKKFLTTPPLFKSAPKNENLLRLMYVGEQLPTDKESIFYFNSKAIPSIEKKEDESSALILATVTRIKLFVRPNGLPILPEKAKELLKFKKTDSGVTITNPSPYYITLSDLKVGSQIVNSVMVPPKDSTFFKVHTGSNNTISFSTINDYGGITKSQTVALD